MLLYNYTKIINLRDFGIKVTFKHYMVLETETYY